MGSKWNKRAIYETNESKRVSFLPQTLASILYSLLIACGVIITKYIQISQGLFLPKNFLLSLPVFSFTLRLMERYRQEKSAPLAQLAPQPNSATMPFSDGFYNCQPKA